MITFKKISFTITKLFFAVIYFLLYFLLKEGFFNFLINFIASISTLNISTIENTMAWTLLLGMFISAILFIIDVVKYFQYSKVDKHIENIQHTKLDDYDFEDKELNSLFEKIKKKIILLKSNIFINGDVESIILLEQIEQESIKTIYTNYMDIPPNKRGDKSTTDSPYNLTLRQLKLILEGLYKIEEKIINI